MEVWSQQTFRATPLQLGDDETSVCSLEVSALTRASLPRPWGEGGPPDGGPGEGQPKEIAPQNVQTPATLSGLVR